MTADQKKDTLEQYSTLPSGRHQRWGIPDIQVEMDYDEKVAKWSPGQVRGKYNQVSSSAGDRTLLEPVRSCDS